MRFTSIKTFSLQVLKKTFPMDLWFNRDFVSWLMESRTFRPLIKTAYSVKFRFSSYSHCFNYKRGWNTKSDNLHTYLRVYLMLLSKINSLDSVFPEWRAEHILIWLCREKTPCAADTNHNRFLVSHWFIVYFWHYLHEATRIYKVWS